MGTIMDVVTGRDPFEKEFHQAVTEVVESVKPVLDNNPEYRYAGIMEPMVEPEREIHRVPLPPPLPWAVVRADWILIPRENLTLK